MSSERRYLLFGAFIWLLAACFFLYEFFLRTFIGSLAHQILPDVGLNAATFSLVGAAYYLTYGLMQVPVGILVDKLGVRLILSVSTLGAALAVIYFAHASGFYSALSSRLLMGFFSASGFVCLLVIALSWFPQRYFGIFAGLSQFIGTMGPLLAGGPLVMLMTSMHLGWRHTMQTIGLIGIALAVLIALFVRDKPRGGEQVMIYLKRSRPLSERLWILLRNHQAWLIALYSGTSYVSIALMATYWGTDFLESVGLSQMVAADMISVSWVGYAIGCPLLGAISDLTLRRKIVLMFAAITGLVTVSLITFINFASHAWVYAILFFALGIASSGQNVGFAAITEHVDPDTRATAIGLNNALMTTLSACLPPLVGWTIYLSAGDRVQFHFSDFTWGFTLMPLLYVFSLLCCYGIKETYCKPQRELIVLNLSEPA